MAKGLVHNHIYLHEASASVEKGTAANPWLRLSAGETEVTVFFKDTDSFLTFAKAVKGHADLEIARREVAKR